MSLPQSLHHGLLGLLLDQCGTSSHLAQARPQNPVHQVRPASPPGP
eukprot:CAMPEP_0179274300 /NCGR_PEP_ID=MMETSP0797-20121207/33456_1 /TAXON_ID=47934 /ORGANISM="Dinophysis acuminata, Strain DAEP01" /LENGTH=45 /DNA_ID= /DNA_START= /DNA_END= /DNA_ORIENTATION=